MSVVVLQTTLHLFVQQSIKWSKRCFWVFNINWIPPLCLALLLQLPYSLTVLRIMWSKDLKPFNGSLNRLKVHSRLNTKNQGQLRFAHFLTHDNQIYISAIKMQAILFWAFEPDHIDDREQKLKSIRTALICMLGNGSEKMSTSLFLF